ncbi:hypothetical protein [Streptomyces sp. NPDC002851]
MKTSLTQDVASALNLARYAPASEPAAHLRARLRDRLGQFIDPATRYADGLPDCRARDVATDTVRHARRLRTSTELFDPAAELRLLAKSLEILSSYADTQARTEAERDKAEG